MFFILFKVLVFFFKFIIWVVGLLFLSWFFVRLEWKCRYVMFVFVLLLLFFNGFIFNMVISVWELEMVMADKIEKFYVVGILFGGYFNFNICFVYDWYNFNECVNCFVNVLELYKKGKV